ncbi:MAG TPA: 2-amino-4-hydroxy-6-hydroxymethyldihydropteridine diphosphokinase [Candidatus Omnitrophota bacterium]|nr:2-amino-4-hydroxy-6-hydroxymethyldihydropteridine diphosphokinase [Candidatus Omnitrophota bacterium]HQJ15786.1 2-amino-4-hydroxy-6-hydroxymethyldihydropteridine diphosphokinase [Candidatus Omnitrophota bacterium]
MVVCYIGLGSNLGDRRHYINAALKKMKLLTRTKVRKISGVIETLPEGGPPQGPYLNAVAEIETDLGPYQLLAELQNIESSLGRVRTMVNGPRTIDLDILIYGDIRMREEALCIPHPRMLERKFVLVPLEEIAPKAIEAVKRILSVKKPVKKAVKKVVKRSAKKIFRLSVKKQKRRKRTK